MKPTSVSKVILGAPLLASLFVLPLLADEGALTPRAIGEIRCSFNMDAHTRAMYNAITNNSIKELALNRDVLQRHNNLFSHKIEAKQSQDYGSVSS